MAKCSKDSGKVKLLRGNPPSTRYVGKCDDCDFITEPESLGMAVFSLDVHYGKKVF